MYTVNKKIRIISSFFRKKFQKNELDPTVYLQFSKLLFDFFGTFAQIDDFVEIFTKERSRFDVR